MRTPRRAASSTTRRAHLPRKTWRLTSFGGGPANPGENGPEPLPSCGRVPIVIVGGTGTAPRNSCSEPDRAPIRRENEVQTLGMQSSKTARLLAVGILGVLFTMLRLGMTTAGAATVHGASRGPTCDGETATIVGSSGDDTLHGTSGDDVIVAKRGDDIVKGRGG